MSSINTDSAGSSLSDLFKEISLSSNESSSSHSTTATSSKSDDVNDVFQRVKQEINDWKAEARPTCDQLSTGEIALPLPNQKDFETHLSTIFNKTKALCSDVNGVLIPPTKQSKEHRDKGPFQLCRDCDPANEKQRLAGVEKNSKQAAHYRDVINLLFSELCFLREFTKYLSNIVQLHYFQKIIADAADSLKGVDMTPSGEVNLDDTADLAFYLRFIKPLNETEECEKAYEILKAQQNMLSQFKAKKSAKIVEMIASIGDRFVKLVNVRMYRHMGNLGPKIQTLMPNLEKPWFLSKLRTICPNYGYFICDFIHQANTVLAVGTEFDTVYKKHIAHQKQCLEDMLQVYLDKQVQIYKCAFENMQKLIEGKPAYKDANFHSFNEDLSIQIYTPKEYQTEIENLKKEIKSYLIHALPVPASEIAKDAKMKEEKEGKKDESKNEKAGIKAEPSHTSKKSKHKRNKNAGFAHSPENSPAEHVSSSSTVSTSPASTPSTVVAFVSAQKTKPTFATAVGDSSKLVPFLIAPRRHYAHPRVRRWLSLDLRTLSKIRDFQDTSNGAPVFKYANMTDGELRDQLILHGASPLIDKLLNDQVARGKYCYLTNSGLGLFVKVRIDDSLDNGITGVLFYGLDQKVYFHRKIELFTMQKIRQLSLSQLVNSSAQMVITQISKVPTNEELEQMEQEIYSGFKGDTVTCDEFEVLHFKDDRLKCIVSVFPLK